MRDTRSEPSIAPSHPVRSTVLFMTSYIICDHRRIGGGVGERYVGLYGSLIKRYSKIYNVFWYATNTNNLYRFDKNGRIAKLTKVPMPMAILKVLAEAKKDSDSMPPLTTTIAYHYAASSKPVSFMISLVFLFFLRIIGLANVIVDIIDPPVEVHVTYSRFPSVKKIFLGTVLDLLTLNLGTTLITVSNSYQKYLTQKYRLLRGKTFVIHNATFPKLIAAKPPEGKGPLTIFYSGSLMDVKGIPQLIECIADLRDKGLAVSLLLTGGNLKIEEKPWVKSVRINDWLKWTKVLSDQADICVIPYPRRVHWDFTHHCKLSDYMAAGKPIVSMYGTETAYILDKCECGLTANSWKQFGEHILRLYKDREFAKSLGQNGRKAVEKLFDYATRAEMLHNVIQQHLRHASTRVSAAIDVSTK